MHGHLLALSSALALVTLLGCGSSTPPPDDPLSNADPGPGTDTAGGGDQTAPSDTPPATDPEPSKGAEPKKNLANSENSIPDDYLVTHGDCVLLGKQFGVVTRNDQVANLSPKLTEKQRAQAEKSIDEGSMKTGEKFAESCQKSIAGNHGDAKALKCALNAKSAKEFDACLNAAAPPK